MPRLAASIVASAAAAAPRKSELRVPEDDLREDVGALIGRAEEVLQRGPCFASSSEYAVGSCVAISGAKIATTSIAASTIRPMHDFGLRSSRRSHSGSPGSGGAARARHLLQGERHGGARCALVDARPAGSATRAPPSSRARAGRGPG